MRGKARMAAGAVVASAASVLVISSLAGASDPGSAPVTVATPLWEVHVKNYPGGISNGVRQAFAVSQAAVASPTASPRPAVGPSEVSSGNIQMDQNSYPPMPQNETAVAFNTSNEQVAVAASNDYVSGGITVMRTSDGGHSWQTTRVVPVYSHAGDPISGNTCQGGDPSVAYSARAQVFYASQLCFFRGLPQSEVQIFVSRDNGATWTPGRQAAIAATNFSSSLGGADTSVFNDRPTITVDNTPSSPHYGRLYVTWTKFHMLPSGFSDYCPIQLAYTDNVPVFNPKLTTFVHSAVVPDNPGGNGLGPSANQDSQPVVEPNGTLHVSYVEEECNTAIDHHLFIRNSNDGGTTFTRAIQIDKPGQFKDNPDPADLLPNKNFRAPIAPSLNYNVATGTLAFMYQNNLDRKNSGANISAQTSTDGGKTWSNMRWVSVDSAGNPAPNDQYFSWVTSSPNGTFRAIWLDNRQDPGNKLIDTWQGISSDNGQTWKNSRLSTVLWNPDLGFFTSGAFIGDYQGAAAGKGVFYPVWVDGRTTAIAETGIGNTDIFTNVP
jgi:BNR/Asp-box repeat